MVWVPSRARAQVLPLLSFRFPFITHGEHNKTYYVHADDPPRSFPGSPPGKSYMAQAGVPSHHSPLLGCVT